MTVTENVKKLIILAMVLLACNTTWAQLEIEIISGNPSALPIAIVPFQWQDAGPSPTTSVDVCSVDKFFYDAFFVIIILVTDKHGVRNSPEVQMLFYGRKAP